MPNIFDAWNNSFLDGCIVESIGMREMCSGQMIGCSKDFIFIKIQTGFEDCLRLSKKDGHLFNISYHINRLPFQLQHNALKWVKDHSLFDKLISYPMYWADQQVSNLDTQALRYSTI